MVPRTEWPLSFVGTTAPQNLELTASLPNKTEELVFCPWCPKWFLGRFFPFLLFAGLFFLQFFPPWRHQRVLFPQVTSNHLLPFDFSTF